MWVLMYGSDTGKGKGNRISFGCLYRLDGILRGRPAVDGCGETGEDTKYCRTVKPNEEQSLSYTGLLLSGVVRNSSNELICDV